jgi:hypothetical protein
MRYLFSWTEYFGGFISYTVYFKEGEEEQMINFMWMTMEKVYFHEGELTTVGEE